MKRPRRLCNFRGPSRERLIDSRRLFIAVTSSTKRICFRQKYQESLRIVEYPLPRLIRLGRLEIHIALSNPNIDVRILAQGYCVAIVYSLSLL